MTSADYEDSLAGALLADADAHARNRFDDIGERYDDVLTELLPFKDRWTPRVSLAFRFWDGWVDARNHDWQYYRGIARDDWPRLARVIARSLQEGVELTDPELMAHFGPRAHRSWLTRFSEWRRGRSSESSRPIPP